MNVANFEAFSHLQLSVDYKYGGFLLQKNCFCSYDCVCVSLCVCVLCIPVLALLFLVSL